MENAILVPVTVIPIFLIILLIILIGFYCYTLKKESRYTQQ